jgi:hypothetical protein
MSKEETFFIEEYKALRKEIDTKLKDGLEFNRWGLIGLAALYSYIFANPGRTILFWVPVFFSALVITHINEEHRMVEKAGVYITSELERWILGGQLPRGWGTFLLDPAYPTPRWWLVWRRWPWHLWDWSPVPMWIVIFLITLGLALAVTFCGRL